MGAEVSYGETKFYAEFKLEAVRLIRDRGVSHAHASEDLKVHPTQLDTWVKAFGGRSAVRVPQPQSDEARAAEDRASQAGSNQAEAGRDIRRKAAAYFATESTWSSDSWRAPGDLAGRLVVRALGVSRGGFYACAPAQPRR